MPAPYYTGIHPEPRGCTVHVRRRGEINDFSELKMLRRFSIDVAFGLARVVTPSSSRCALVCIFPNSLYRRISFNYSNGFGGLLAERAESLVTQMEFYGIRMYRDVERNVRDFFARVYMHTSRG